MNDPKPRSWTMLNGLAVIVPIAGAGYLLLSEHQAHSIAVLPVTVYLLSG